jgi:hypothetical protein
VSDDDKPADKADRIRKKISASQARTRGEGTARKAKPKSEPKPRATRRKDDRSFFDKALDDHPLALLAGSVVLGAIAASLVPASLSRKLGSRMLGLAAVAGELGATYGNKAWGAAAEGARAGQGKLEDLSEVLADHGADAGRRAVELGALAGKRALELAESAARSAREAGGGAVKAIGDLSDRVRH